MELTVGVTIYILHLVDGGIIRRTCARYELSELLPLVEQECFNFLMDNGFTASDTVLSLDDGYAEIIRVNMYPSNDEEKIWTYHFDGTERLDDSLKQIKYPVEAANPTILTEEKMRTLINVSLGRSVPLMGDIIVDMMRGMFSPQSNGSDSEN
ncbi:hypothetical protein C0Q44_28210 [Paenibacillus sp. PCH8]|uniref:hypothetical protein n=1 Tax=Paenibacillus sp. PCH8 TaxID=2066524 RepID=UPI000CFA4172|nr:hypothetical protein [Paenibacillus sp. PCH8]PQP80300.1 hypothetical protein C0Q44_28210 [Paenibacillus sp. PCH8]